MNPKAVLQHQVKLGRIQSVEEDLAGKSEALLEVEASYQAGEDFKQGAF